MGEETNVHVAVNQNLGLGILGGMVAAIIAAAIWAAITYFTDYQISYMAVGVGFLVGFGVNYFGQGTGPEYGLIAAVLSFAGCVLGNILAIVSLVADIWAVAWREALNMVISQPELLKEILIDNIEVIDIFFYIIAIYVGYAVATGAGGKKKTEAGPSVYS